MTSRRSSLSSLSASFRSSMTSLRSSSKAKVPVVTTTAVESGNQTKRQNPLSAAWSDFKDLARSHHRAVNGAYEGLYGNGVYRYGPNAARIGGLYQAEARKP